MKREVPEKSYEFGFYGWHFFCKKAVIFAEGNDYGISSLILLSGSNPTETQGDPARPGS
jgi:hypothetical protein